MSDKQENKRKKISQSVLIREFEKKHKDSFYYIPELKCWTIYDGKRWLFDGYNLLYEEMFELLSENYPEGTSNDELLIKRSINIMENLLKYHKPASIFDTHPEYFNCQNGILDLKSGEFFKHNDKAKNLFISKISNVEYDKEAKCERFEQFISEIFENCSDKIELGEYLQKVLGYLISGYTKSQSFFFFHGDGANGKTTLMETIKNVVGEYSKTFNKGLLTNKNAQITGHIYKELKGRRIINVNEFLSTDKINENTLKQLTGSDTLRIEIAENIVIEDKLPSKFIGITNYLPTVDGGGHSFFRRVRLIIFDRIFNSRTIDIDLLEKLQKEKNGIFNWLYNGYKKYAQNHILKEPVSLNYKISEVQRDFMKWPDTPASRILAYNPCHLLNAVTLYNYMLYIERHTQRKFPQGTVDVKHLGSLLYSAANGSYIKVGNFKLYKRVGINEEQVTALYGTPFPITLYMNNSKEEVSGDKTSTHVDFYILHCEEVLRRNSISDKQRNEYSILLDELNKYRDSLEREDLYMCAYEYYNL